MHGVGDFKPKNKGSRNSRLVVDAARYVLHYVESLAASVAVARISEVIGSVSRVVVQVHSTPCHTHAESGIKSVQLVAYFGVVGRGHT